MHRPVLASLAVAALSGAFFGAAPAFAADLGARPTVVSRIVLREPVVVAPPSVWLGPVSGGRNLAPGADPIPLDWVDVRQRFASLGECSAWLRAMRRAYPTYEGWKTCLVVR